MLLGEDTCGFPALPPGGVVADSLEKENMYLLLYSEMHNAEDTSSRTATPPPSSDRRALTRNRSVSNHSQSETLNFLFGDSGLGGEDGTPTTHRNDPFE
jgi:hypothetical protein